MKTIYQPESKKIEIITDEEFHRIHQEQVDLNKVKTIVFKVGSDLLDTTYISKLADYLSKLRDSGKRITLVSSGAIKTAKEIIELEGDKALNQAYAAIGQPILMTRYALAFGNKKVGQNLLTGEDLRESDPKVLEGLDYVIRFLRDHTQIYGKHLDSIEALEELLKKYQNSERRSNTINTLNLMMDQRIIPIVNENDTVATNEIKFGDNDTLSALTAVAINADALVMLSKHGLYDKKPEQKNGARLINIIPYVDDAIKSYAGTESTGYGAGGMKTKVEAAENTTKEGIPAIVLDGKSLNDLDVFKGKYQGTLFCAGK